MGNKRQIVATKAFCQMVTHISKIPVFISMGFVYIDRWLLILLLSLAAFAGTRLGVSILTKIPKSAFVGLYKVALFTSALRLIFKIAEF